MLSFKENDHVALLKNFSCGQSASYIITVIIPEFQTAIPKQRVFVHRADCRGSGWSWPCVDPGPAWPLTFDRLRNSGIARGSHRHFGLLSVLQGLRIFSNVGISNVRGIFVDFQDLKKIFDSDEIIHTKWLLRECGVAKYHVLLVASNWRNGSVQTLQCSQAIKWHSAFCDVICNLIVIFWESPKNLSRTLIVNNVWVMWHKH